MENYPILELFSRFTESSLKFVPSPPKAPLKKVSRSLLKSLMITYRKLDEFVTSRCVSMIDEEVFCA